MADPALPKGFVLEEPEPALPAGFVIASDEQGQERGTLSDIVAGATRGVGPIAGGAALGAAIGAPIGGVGAIPGGVAGAGAVALSQLIGDPIIGAINSAFGTSITTPTKALEELMTRAGIPLVQGEAGRIAQAATAGAAGAGGIASAGRAIQSAAGQTAPVVAGVGQQLASGLRQQIAGGASGGAAGQVAAESGAGPVGQIAAALAGGVAGAKAAGTSSIKVPKNQAVAEAERLGIPVMTSDVKQPKTFAGKWSQTAGERVPVVGTGPVRAAQQGKRIDAIRDVLREFGADDAAQASDNVMADLLKKRGADVGKYSQMKKEVIERLDGAGKAPVVNASKAIDDQVNRLSGLKTEEVAPVIAKLTDFKKAIQNQGLVNIEELRKQLGESFKAPEMAAVRSTGEKALSGIYGPLKQDMRSFIANVGQRRDVTKWSVADRQLSSMMDDLKSTAIKNALKRGDATPEVVKNVLFGKRESDLRTLYQGLTPDGRSNARASILAEAYRMSGDSPEKFISALGKLGAPVNVFFKGDDLQRLRGLERALVLTRRAGDAAVNPPTGQQLALPVGAAVLTDMLGSGGAALATGAGIGGIARIYESAPVRNILISIPKFKAGSQEEAAAVKRLIAVIQQQQNKEAQDARN